ncbi:hypothetical protein HDU91_005649 [Kappamyces sp. JEL0680]|nr:hypothetical protein HDU91_005649 [Kappamyces sp. JEL0680]
MVNEKGPIAREIQEVFDPEFLAHQVQNNAFDLAKLVGYVGEKMLQLCAPVRDAEIRALSTEQDVTAVMFKMLDIMEAMKLDLANFRLQSVKPQLKRQAVDYERQKFDHALRIGAASLTKTDLWLMKASQELQKVADERNPENLDHPDLKLKFAHIFNHALLSTLFSTTPVNLATLPETLSMDGKRIFEMQNELQAMTIVAALTMLSKNIIPELRTETAAMHELAQELFVLLKQEGTNIATLAMAIISAANLLFHKHTKVIANLSQMTSSPAQQTLKQVSGDQETLIHSMVEKTLSHKDPFFSVLSRRMERIVRVALEKEFKHDSLKKNGLELIASEFEPLVKRIDALAQHNRDVYGAHYNAILKKYVV